MEMLLDPIDVTLDPVVWEANHLGEAHLNAHGACDLTDHL